MEVKFCRRCGAPVSKTSQSAYKCQNGHSLFYDASPAGVAILLNAEGQIGLTLRAHEPRKGFYDKPGGFCDYGENLEQALARELREELGLEPSDYETPRYFMSTHDFYDWEGNTTRTLAGVFIVRLKPGVVCTPGDDVERVDFVDPQDIPFDRLAFESTKITYQKYRDKIA